MDLRRALDRLGHVFEQRQRHDELRPLALPGTVSFDVAAMGIHEMSDDRQTESQTTMFGTVSHVGLMKLLE